MFAGHIISKLIDQNIMLLVVSFNVFFSKNSILLVSIYQSEL